jgi:hypothetical protein
VALTLFALLVQTGNLRPLLDSLGAVPGSRLLLELQPQECSAERLVAAVRLVPR